MREKAGERDAGWGQEEAQRAQEHRKKKGNKEVYLWQSCHTEHETNTMPSQPISSQTIICSLNKAEILYFGTYSPSASVVSTDLCLAIRNFFSVLSSFQFPHSSRLFGFSSDKAI